jgi:Starch-binding associating with outer membrane/Susd and RagB outer membrane lipoprotein
MKKYFYKLIFILTIVFFSGCETFDLDQTVNPSTLNDTFIDPILAYNYVQLQLPDFVDSANSFTQRVTRQMAMTGGNTYDNAFAPVNSNNNWSIGYNILNAIKISEPKSIQNKELFILGANKIIRCYILLTLVDLYGDIPESEALLGSQNITPKYDKGADVYKKVLSELDEAIVTLNQSTKTPEINLYYSSPDGWIKLANTLKLKMYNTCRLSPSEIGIANLGASFSAIVSSGKYIKEPSDEFAFNYSTSRFNPNTRHPLYNDQYELGGGAYIGNYMFWTMTVEKGATGSQLSSPEVIDPRTDFYFYRQADPGSFNDDTFSLPGRTRPSHYDDGKYASFFNPAVTTPYSISNWVKGSSVPSGGFWGRDHGDNSGIPTDANKRSVGGLYPIGGKYKTGSVISSSVQTSGVEGAKGQGVMPFIMSSYVHFMIAEASLKIPGVSTNPEADAKNELILAIDQSIARSTAKVNGYPSLSTIDRPYENYAEGTYQPGTILINGVLNTIVTQNYSTYGKITIQSKNIYLDFIKSIYDQSSSSKKLELIIKEYYIAAWGNGIEPYNNYRRTGYPSNFQPTLEPVSGDFYYTAFYPGSAVNNNPNTPSNLRTRKVFWDKANLNLH